jgi:hypothetical protein
MGPTLHNAQVESSMWGGVRERLLAAFPPQRGESALLAPPLSLDDVEDLESWLGVRLPQEYRTFLIDVTAGGLGVHQVERGDRLPPRSRHRPFLVNDDGSLIIRPYRHEWEWVGQGPPAIPEWVMKPFDPLRADNETRMRMRGAPPFEENYADPDHFQHPFDEWAAQANNAVNSRDRTAGAIQVLHRGLEGADYLVVTGPARGQIWRSQGLGRRPGPGPRP